MSCPSGRSSGKTQRSMTEPYCALAVLHVRFARKYHIDDLPFCRQVVGWKDMQLERPNDDSARHMKGFHTYQRAIDSVDKMILTTGPSPKLVQE